VTARATPEAARSTFHALASNRRDTAKRVAGGGPLALRMPFGLDFWWVYLFQLGVLPRALAVTAAVGLLSGGAALARRAVRQASDGLS
jgi:hypothetical protein